ncbi:MAG: motility associated factor glycosyltransferase family protein, partial [Spirochaetota bacterium]
AVLIESVPASSYYGRFQDTDAVIVGAGPSLVDTLPELTKIQESCLIIAVDTSYRICLDNGVIPHFVLCADPQLINARYFEQITESDTVLIADPACHPSVLRLFKGPHALSGMPFDMFSWIEEITGEMGEITHGGSVSTNAYDFAKRLGVPRVYLVGQDLGFTHNLAHCRGSYLDEMMFLKVNRFYNQEMANRRQLRALPAIYQPAIGGGTVQTNQKMMIFKQWFERRNDPALLNASSGGMELFAIPHSPLPKGGSAADIRSRVMSIHDAGRISGSERMRRRERVRERIDRISNENDLLLEKLVQAVEHALRLREVIGQRGAEREAQQLIGKLDAVDEYIGRFSASKSIVGMSVQRTIHTVQEGYDLDTEECSDAERIAGRSHYLYSGLLDGCRFTRRVLAKMSRLFNAS